MQNAKKHYERLLSNSPVEVRCMDTSSRLFERKKNDHPVIWSGVYDEWKCLRQSLTFAMSAGWNIYTTINSIDSAATNEKLKPFQRTVSDRQITRMNTIFFDFDPVDKPSTQEGMDAALIMAVDVALYLHDRGWSKPSLCDSGNGTHLLYAVDMPVTNLKYVYKHLADNFTSDLVVFDVAVKNPARITRAYGTVNKKGGRRSGIEFNGGITDEKCITDMITEYTPPPRPKVKRTWVKPDNKYMHNIDILSLASSVYLESTTDLGKHWIECPWVNEHSFIGATDTVIWEGEWPQFHCSHNCCDGRDIRDFVAVMGANQ